MPHLTLFPTLTLIITLEDAAAGQPLDPHAPVIRFSGVRVRLGVWVMVMAMVIVRVRVRRQF